MHLTGQICLKLVIYFRVERKL